ncbi:MAG: hypothetical protein EXS58_05035 [Candidatus Latescibacteria bacterium]|nr:hypothetical protein [Candidatus Latescibacterota bacterium]
MPGLWIASVFIVLALEGAPAAAVSLSTTPSPELVGPDTLVIGADIQVAAPMEGDSQQSPWAADSLSQSAVEPVPSLLPPPPVPLPSPTPGYLPKRSSFAAQRRGYFTPRTLWAAGYLGGSFLLYNRGSNYRDKADDFYALYQQPESDPAEIEAYYQRTTTQDTKGQVCWALSAALAINGLRLLFAHETEVVSSEVSRPSLQMILAPPSLQLRVRKWL